MLASFRWASLGLALAVAGSAASTLATPPAQRAERQYFLSRSLYLERGTTNQQDAWQFSQACFEWAEFARNNGERADIANEGIAAARAALRQDTNSAPAVYYLALNIGQLARTKMLGALKLVSEMEGTLKQAIDLDPAVDFAGPHRSLGMLYRDAPGWPASVGSKSKARQHLLKAVQLQPEFPENHMCLVETYVQWGEKSTARAISEKVQEVLKAGREKFGGETWEASWQDWDRRWEAVRERIQPH